MLYHSTLPVSEVNPETFYFDTYSEQAKTTRLAYGSVKYTGTVSGDYSQVEVITNTDSSWIGDKFYVVTNADPDGSTAYQLYEDAGTTALDYWVTITRSEPVVRDLSISVNDGADEPTAISGASVNVMHSTGTTGTAGGCTIKDVKDGKCWISVTKEGYTDYLGSITVDSTHTSFTVSLTEA